MLVELDAFLGQFEAQRPRGLVLISGKKSGFIAGADIREFTALADEAAGYALIRRGQAVFDRLEALPCPTVAAIHGFALGRRTGAALACRYRVAVAMNGCRSGCRRYSSGMHPGFGGTVRTVRLSACGPRWR